MSTKQKKEARESQETGNDFPQVFTKGFPEVFGTRQGQGHIPNARESQEK